MPTTTGKTMAFSDVKSMRSLPPIAIIDNFSLCVHLFHIDLMIL